MNITKICIAHGLIGKTKMWRIHTLTRVEKICKIMVCLFNILLGCKNICLIEIAMRAINGNCVYLSLKHCYWYGPRPVLQYVQSARASVKPVSHCSNVCRRLLQIYFSWMTFILIRPLDSVLRSLPDQRVVNSISCFLVEFLSSGELFHGMYELGVCAFQYPLIILDL